MSRHIWKFLTSLRVTIVLLALAIVLVFVGTVAQADEGLYQVQNRYFRHWWVMGTTLWGHKMPWFIWPGGYTLGVGLLVNLIAAHIKRFQWSMSKVGIHLTHLGIIILLVGQLATDMLQQESTMAFNEGEAESYIARHRERELVFTSDAGKDQEQVVSIPEKLLAQGGDITNRALPFTVRVKHYEPNGDFVSNPEVVETANKLTAALVTMESEYVSADQLVPQAQKAEQAEGRVEVWRAALRSVGVKEAEDIVAAADKVAKQPELEGKLRTELKSRFRQMMLRGFTAQGGASQAAAQKIAAGETVTAESMPTMSTNGVGAHSSVTSVPEAKDEDTRNFPFAVLEILAGGKSLGTWLVITGFVDGQEIKTLRPQEIDVDGKVFHVALREERQYLPFSIKLLKATHKNYAGSDTPKDFRSRVMIDNPTTKENREVEISMNDPLRYGGLAFYQYQMTKDEFDRAPGQSILQVVHNPSWLAPYIGCIVVAAGMLWQFLHHLVGFITKRRPRPI
jgi:hypothetical protein